MNRKEAEALSKRIERDDPLCRVTGIRNVSGTRALDVTDTRTGDSFVVASPEQWAERHNWAQLAAANPLTK